MYRSLLALALLLSTPLVCAQVYTWTDAGGTVHYSQTPPPQGTRYKQIKTPGVTAPAQPAPAVAVAAANQPESTDQAATAAKSDQPIADTPENRKLLCSSLQSNLDTLKGSAPVVMQQDGKSIALDDSQRQQQIASSEAQYQQYCQAP